MCVEDCARRAHISRRSGSMLPRKIFAFELPENVSRGAIRW